MHGTADKAAHARNRWATVPAGAPTTTKAPAVVGGRRAAGTAEAAARAGGAGLGPPRAAPCGVKKQKPFNLAQTTGSLVGTPPGKIKVWALGNWLRRSQTLGETHFQKENDPQSYFSNRQANLNFPILRQTLRIPNDAFLAFTLTQNFINPQ